MEGKRRAHDATRARQTERLPGKVGQRILHLQPELQGKAETLGLLDLLAERVARRPFEDLASERFPDLQKKSMEGGLLRGRARSVALEGGLLGLAPVAGAFH